MHVVEVRRRAADLGVIMAQMRTRADHQKMEVSLFEMAFLPDREVRFRLEFQAADDALAFARVFGEEPLTGTERTDHAA